MLNKQVTSAPSASLRLLLTFCEFIKLYAVKKSILIIYRIVEDEVVVEVVGVGKREDFEIYADVVRRLLKR